MKWSLIFLLLFWLVGCATTETQRVWVKPGASQQDFYMDSGQCKAQAFSAPGMPPLQVAIIYNTCMQGKGWYQEERPIR